MNSAEGFKIFSDLYFSTANRQQYHGHTRKYHETIWKTLSEAGIARLYVAFYEGRPQAAFEIFFWHDRAYYPYSGSASTDRSIPSTQYLMWHVIRAAKEHGAKTLDLWGSLPEVYDKKHPWAGFTLFKSGFGTRFVHMTPSHDQVVMPVLYLLYSIAYKIRSLIWKGGGL
jgi:lipid II:glycine glycyltransferase (peptidoglycan interpeptide bridge formation enzyme)